MKVVAYFRQNTDPVTAATELAVQRRLVADWLTQTSATLVAEFTEAEVSGKARPAFGMARRRAKEAAAVILVATTKAIGPRGRFNPASKSGIPHIHAIEDPAEVDRRHWEKSTLIVVYLRRLIGTHPDPNDGFAMQSDAVEKLVLPNIHTVLSTFIEDEVAHPAGALVTNVVLDRHALDAALALCRKRRARLVIGTTDALGGGNPFVPSFTDVPFEVAFRIADRWLESLPAPESTAGMPLAIYFGDHQVRNRRPVYLVNRAGLDFVDVTVTRSGWTLGFGDLTQMQPSVTEIDGIKNGIGRLIGTYELCFDSDFTISWRVIAKNGEGQTWAGGVTLCKGGPPWCPLPLLDWQVATKPSDC